MSYNKEILKNIINEVLEEKFIPAYILKNAIEKFKRHLMKKLKKLNVPFQFVHDPQYNDMENNFRFIYEFKGYLEQNEKDMIYTLEKQYYNYA